MIADMTDNVGNKEDQMDKRLQAWLEDVLHKHHSQDHHVPLHKTLAVITTNLEKLNWRLPEQDQLMVPSRYTLVRSIQAFKRIGSVTTRYRSHSTIRKQPSQEGMHLRRIPNYLIIDRAAEPGNDIILALWIKDQYVQQHLTVPESGGF
jgi:hypothetical protein